MKCLEDKVYVVKGQKDGTRKRWLKEPKRKKIEYEENEFFK